jgi:uncharacterized protein YndB with AHSA1/START domain
MGTGFDRAIVGEIAFQASMEDVWQAWTTEAGVCTFFAPRAHIDLCPGGAYEMFFDLDEQPGRQGGEGMHFIAIQPKQMLSFTWNAPPELPTVRGEMTHVMVRLYPLAEKSTKVTLRHDGWGSGGEWDLAFAYFERAWLQIVLPRLKYRFVVGPIDWGSPPTAQELAKYLDSTHT